MFLLSSIFVCPNDCVAALIKSTSLSTEATTRDAKIVPSWSFTLCSSHITPSTPADIAQHCFHRYHVSHNHGLSHQDPKRVPLKHQDIDYATYLALGPTRRARTAVARLDKHGLIGSRPSQTSLTATDPTEDYSILFDEHANGSTRQFAQAALLSTRAGMRQWVWVSASV